MGNTSSLKNRVHFHRIVYHGLVVSYYRCLLYSYVVVLSSGNAILTRLRNANVGGSFRKANLDLGICSLISSKKRLKKIGGRVERKLGRSCINELSSLGAGWRRDASKNTNEKLSTIILTRLPKLLWIDDDGAVAKFEYHYLT